MLIFYEGGGKNPSNSFGVYIRLVSFCFFLVFSSFTLLAQQNKELTLESVLTNYCFRSADAKKLEIANKRSKLEISNFHLSEYPTIHFSLNPIGFSHSIVSLQDPVSGNYNYTNNYVNNSNAGITIRQPINLTGGVFELHSNLNMRYQFSSKQESYNTSPINVSYYQSLIGGRKLYKFNKHINRLKERSIEMSYKKALYSVQCKSVELYMNVIMSKYALNSAIQSKQLSDTTYSVAKIMDSLNNITEKEFLQAELQSKQAEADVHKKQMQYRNSLRALLSYLDMEYSDYYVKMPNNTLPYNIKEEEAINDASSNNPIFFDNEIKRTEISKEIYRAKISKGFNANISLSYGLNQYGTTIKEAYRKPTHQQSITVGVTFPIVDWGIGNNNYKVTELRCKSEMLDIATAEKLLYDELKAMVDEYNYIIKMLDVAKMQQETSEKQYRLLVNLFKMGEATLIELTTAKSQYTQMSESYYRLIVQGWTIYYKIREITLKEY